MKQDLRSATAEFLGTFALVFIGAWAICTNEWSGQGLGLLGIAIAHGTVLAVMISAMGHISGGHFNPAVTIGMLSVDKIDGAKAATYVAAQLLGAVVAAFLLKTIVPAHVWQAVSLGTPVIDVQMTAAQATLLEAVLTFFLVLAVFGTAVDTKGSWNAVAGFGIGTVLVFDILVGGPLTGAAMNPARAFGPALASGLWLDHPVYWLGPLVGGVIAANVYTRVFLTKR